MANNIYGKGDICLNINPFDNYRMFTLYEDMLSGDRKPIDLSNGQKVYIVFKSGKKEIRIPEYEAYSVDKVNGQVLFKISQKNAIDILSMENKTFYITRVYETTDMSGEKVISSDEEVMYTGMWKDESSNTIENYTSQIKKLMSLLDDRNNTIKNLQESNVKLIEQNVNFATELEKLKEENDKLSSDISELETRITAYESGEEFQGTVLGTGNQYTVIGKREYTEDEWKEIVGGKLQEVSNI